MHHKKRDLNLVKCWIHELHLLSQKLFWCVWMCERISVFTDLSWYSVSAKSESASNEPPLFPWTLLSIDECFRSVFPLSLSFPYMEICSPGSIIAGIHQDMQFACLPGSVTCRSTACNCLSHRLQKNSAKQLHQRQPGCSQRGRMCRRRGELPVCAAASIAPSWCQWDTAISFPG